MRRPPVYSSSSMQRNYSAQSWIWCTRQAFNHIQSHTTQTSSPYKRGSWIERHRLTKVKEICKVRSTYILFPIIHSFKPQLCEKGFQEVREIRKFRCLTFGVIQKAKKQPSNIQNKILEKLQDISDNIKTFEKEQADSKVSSTKETKEFKVPTKSKVYPLRNLDKNA